VWSRFAIGLGAWLLGAATATAGSVYAVDQLGQDLLMQQSKQVSVSMVNSELALENAEHKTPLTGISPSATHVVRSARKHHRHHGMVGPSPVATPTTGTGQLLTSPDGTAVATCQNGLAYLMYVSPYNGFEVDDVHSGPARYASVTFQGPSGGGLVMTVSCTAGHPYAHISHDT
jgi:hypothetical protein